MVYSLRISTRAEAETIDATNYYDQINPELGDRFLSDLTEAYRKIIANPLFYSYISTNPTDKFGDTRLKFFPFVVIYEIENTTIIITAVMNTHRKPIDLK